jgi:hypothetical protein
MSPFRSSKNNITSSSSSVRAVEGRDTLGASIGRNNAFETWTYGNYRYYSFTGDGFFHVLRSGPIDVALIGGGGAGGNGTFGGGGGAGAFVENYNLTFPIGRYDVVIGQGGTGGRGSELTHHGGTSKLVGPSSFTDIEALGGSRGAGPSATASSTQGSGGGSYGSYGFPFSSAKDIRYGSPGGNGKATSGGGGGGAGSPGSVYDPANVYTFAPVTAPVSNTPVNTGMLGGQGKAMFGGDLGIPEDYGYNTPNTPYAANGRHFAGGGGGGENAINYAGYMRHPGGGGVVGGTAGYRMPTSPSRPLYQGKKNTGSGGSGNSTTAYISGEGGDGILIIRIPIVFAE